MAAARCSCGIAATGCRRAIRTQGLKSGDLKFTLEGERLHGGWVLVRMNGRDRYRRQAHQLAADQASRPGRA